MFDTVSPPQHHKAVTPSDSTDLTKVATKGLFVGTAGDVVVKGTDGVSATYKALSGQYIWGQFSRVMAATTATNIVALGG